MSSPSNPEEPSSYHEISFVLAEALRESTLIPGLDSCLPRRNHSSFTPHQVRRQPPERRLPRLRPGCFSTGAGELSPAHCSPGPIPSLLCCPTGLDPSWSLPLSDKSPLLDIKPKPVVADRRQPADISFLRKDMSLLYLCRFSARGRSVAYAKNRTRFQAPRKLATML